MKKYFIFAAAALVALAACSKTEIDEAPAQKISFEVAKYMQTKAETSLLSETDANGDITQFKDNAWYHSVNDDVQYFMNNLDIKWNTSTTNQWAPDVDYYWPRTGYINFYSYAGTPAPTAYNTEGTLTYTDAVIQYNDNVLVADAAYGYRANATEYQLDHADVEGVPTLFRHYLAKVAFNVLLKTTEGKKSANNHFKVEVLDAYVKVLNKGSLSLTNSDPSTTRTASAPGTAGINPWTNSRSNSDPALDKSAIGWVPAAWSETSGSETVETIRVVTSSPVDGLNMKQLTLNLAENATTQTETADAALCLLAERTVMPQELTSNVVFYIKYKVSSYHTGETDPYSVETLEFSNPLTSFITSTAITAWNRNTKYTYNVIIDPIQTKITFDPAVAEWETGVTENFNPWLN